VGIALARLVHAGMLVCGSPWTPSRDAREHRPSLIPELPPSVNERDGSSTLRTCLGELALQAAALQSTLDADWQASRARLLSAAATRAEESPELKDALLARILPRRQVVRTFSVDLRCEVARRKSTSAQIAIRPLTLGYEVAFGRAESSATRIRLEVCQVTPVLPPPAAP